MKLITLPSQRKVTIGEYVRCWKILKTVSPDKNIGNFNYFPEKASEILKEMNFGLHDRINKHLPYFEKGRKWGSDWQRTALQTSRNVNTPRLVVRYVPFEFRERLKHRIFND